MNERRVMQRLMDEHDMTYDEADAELSRMAEDARDAEQDRNLEEQSK
jgi:hypothetical protein